MSAQDPAAAGRPSMDRNAWIETFRARHGRNPRILHVGNIANNAYLNAKMLRRAGIDADVLCYDYYHIMGCPEWEDAEINGDWLDDFRPDWKHAEIKDYSRPHWFYQSSLKGCRLYIAERREQAVFNRTWFTVRAKFHRFFANFFETSSPTTITIFLRKFNFIVQYGFTDIIKSIIFIFFLCVSIIPISVIFILYIIKKLFITSLNLAPKRTRYRIEKLVPDWYSDLSASGRVSLITRIQGTKIYQELSRFMWHTTSIGAAFDHLIIDFARRFPNRSPLSFKELERFTNATETMRHIFKYYDIIHGYATDPIYPLMTGETPYVAFEHGTIRHLPFEDTAVGKLTALAYDQADHVFITNCDNIVSAEKLGLSHFSFIPHPVNEDFLDSDPESAQLRAHLEARLNTDFIALHPSRQHWTNERHGDWEKGNDIFIRGFARFVHEVNPRASAVFVEWGATVNETKELLENLGVTNNVAWVPPQANRDFVRYVHASDVVADQFYLGAFGSLTPKAMACGTPVLLKLDVTVHEWAFPQMPPVENVENDTQVFEALKRLYEDKDHFERRAQACKTWYRQYHSEHVILDQLINVYGEILESSKTRTKNTDHVRGDH